MNKISTVDMGTVASVFGEAYEHVIANLVGDSKILAMRFAAEIILREKPFMLVSPEGVAHIQNLVFGHPTNQDFILTLTTTFFARLAENTEFIEGMIASVARGCALANKSDYAATPTEINNRLAEFDDTFALLQANYWLVVVLMLQLFIRVLPEALKVPLPTSETQRGQ